MDSTARLAVILSERACLAASGCHGPADKQQAVCRPCSKADFGHTPGHTQDTCPPWTHTQIWPPTHTYTPTHTHTSQPWGVGTVTVTLWRAGSLSGTTHPLPSLLKSGDNVSLTHQPTCKPQPERQGRMVVKGLYPQLQELQLT